MTAPVNHSDAMPTTPPTKVDYPVLPLRDVVLFPRTMTPLFVGRKLSVAAITAAMAEDRQLILVAQKDAENDQPSPDELFPMGTLARIVQYVVRRDGTFKIVVEGEARVRVNDCHIAKDHWRCKIIQLSEPADEALQCAALLGSLRNDFAHYAKLSTKIPPELQRGIAKIASPAQYADTIATHLPLKHFEKQRLLEEMDLVQRLELLIGYLHQETDIIQVAQRVRHRVKKQMQRSEKEYYLNEQMRAIQQELGDKDGDGDDNEQLLDALAALNIPTESRARIEKEIGKLQRMPAMSSEATVVRNYVDWCLDLPWRHYRDEAQDLSASSTILDEDHYGLDKPKERILEFLAVNQLVGKIEGPILCLVGPPGVGKTSLARSIARATGRDFVRQSLGGVRDEAEIRGHRRTYIGAMPGKIIQSLKRAGSSNPVFLLDEIDKMTMDMRGDPSSALLEVLDPEQNNAFVDHYLDLDYDLSNVMFICTANTLQGIPAPLQDRLEIIRLSGYTEQEKMTIAKRYLIPKQQEKNGIGEQRTNKKVSIKLHWSTDASRYLIQRYTREAGVRTLERQIASVCRKLAKVVVESSHDSHDFRVNPKKINTLLGVEPYQTRLCEEHSEIGMATGLAWTQMGGDILQIEVTTMPGKGKLTITGKLGDVMQESAQAAMSYVRARAKSWGIEPTFYQTLDIHIHVPEGATPKDGPSAGITMATALVSALTKIPVRKEVAMTGEITLRGRVLTIGGLKEKVLGAHRAGVTEIILPADNKKDLHEIPSSIAKKLTFHTVDHLDDVLRHALEFDFASLSTSDSSPELSDETTLVLNPTAINQ